MILETARQRKSSIISYVHLNLFYVVIELYKASVLIRGVLHTAAHNIRAHNFRRPMHYALVRSTGLKFVFRFTEKTVSRKCQQIETEILRRPPKEWSRQLRLLQDLRCRREWIHCVL